MKKITCLLFAATVLMASCKKDDPAPTPTPTEQPTAKVKFTNATVNTSTIAVRINDVALADAQALNFLTTTGYLKTAYGANTKVSFVFPNTGSVFKEMTTNLGADTYSAFLGGELPTDVSMIVINDNLTAPAAGKAKVRFVNLSIDNFNMSFFVGGPKLDSNIAYMGYTPFREVSSGAQNVLVQDPANPGYFQTINGQEFTAGKIYTIILTGKNGGGGDATPKLTVITNN